MLNTWKVDGFDQDWPARFLELIKDLGSLPRTQFGTLDGFGVPFKNNFFLLHVKMRYCLTYTPGAEEHLEAFFQGVLGR